MPQTSSSTPTFGDLPTSSHHIKESLMAVVLRFVGIAAISFILTAVAGVILILYASQAFSTPTVATLFLIVYLVLHVTGWSGALLVVLRLITQNCYLTPTHLIYCSGIIKIDESIYELKHLKAVKLHQGVGGRIFEYGDLQIFFSASGGFHEEVRCKDITNPKLYEQILKGYLVS